MIASRPIMVIGCPRSGTTLLQLMLHAHPRIAIPPENRFVLPAYHQRHRFGDLREPANRRRLAEWLVHGPKTKFAHFGLDPDPVVAEIVAGPPTLGSALAIVFRAYAARFGKPRWGDKRPSYVSNLEIVRQLYPTAQFVHIVRDGRDCVASLKGKWWHRGGSYEAVSRWAQAVDHAARATRRLGPDTFYELRYEDLVRDPERELTGLCGFLGEDYHPAMAEPARVAPLVPSTRSGDHALTHGAVTGSQIGSFTTRLEPWEISLCEAVLAGRLRSYGYQLSGAPSPPVAVRLRYEKIAFRHRFAEPKRLALQGYQWLRRPAPVADLGQLAGHAGEPAGPVG